MKKLRPSRSKPKVMPNDLVNIKEVASWTRGSETMDSVLVGTTAWANRPNVEAISNRPNMDISDVARGGGTRELQEQLR